MKRDYMGIASTVYEPVEEPAWLVLSHCPDVTFGSSRITHDK